MEFILYFFDFLLHLDKYLDLIIRNYGTWTYAILILIFFCETGLVATPFLPGDSVLFAVGTFAALGSFHFGWISLAICVAVISGDSTNYWVGYFAGPKVFNKEKSLFLNKKYLRRTHEFYDRHGSKTIIFARFIPIVRTFAPFVAGIGSMPYKRFLSYSVAGSAAWISIFMSGGYFFGNVAAVRKNFTAVILAIIFISVLPAVVEFVRHKRFKEKKKRG